MELQIYVESLNLLYIGKLDQVSIYIRGKLQIRIVWNLNTYLNMESMLWKYTRLNTLGSNPAVAKENQSATSKLVKQRPPAHVWNKCTYANLGIRIVNKAM
jgi:hypothetical protein